MSDPFEVLGLDHLAVVVPDLEEGMRAWSALLGTEAGGTEEVPTEKVRVAFFELGGTRIELVAPVAEDSPVSGFLKKKGGGIHHLCLRVPDAEAAWKCFSERGLRLIGEGPRQGAGGAVIFFLHPSATGGVLVEIKEDPCHR
jgi:methylmalonyl-CoA epimerase